MKTTITTLAAVAIMTGCTQMPDRIKAKPLAQGAHSGLTCKQLRAKRTATNQELASLSAQQKKAAREDTIGVLFIGIPTARLRGKNQGKEIAALKGKIQSLNKQINRKKCR